MSTFEIVMGILGLAGGAMDLSGHINNTSKLIKLEKQLLNAENHIQLLEFGERHGCIGGRRRTAVSNHSTTG